MAKRPYPSIRSGWLLRIIIGTLLPPVLGPILLLLVLLASESTIPNGDDLLALLLMVIFAFVFVGIQALLSALIMELLLNPYCANGWSVYGSGMVLGMLSTFVFWAGEGEIDLIIGTGAVVGAGTAGLLRRMYRRAQ